IRQSVQRAVANHARTIRVPVHVVERQQKLSRAARRLEVELGREPTKEELAEATGLPLQHVDEALSAASASVSLNQTVGADGDGVMLRPERPFEGRLVRLEPARTRGALLGIGCRFEGISRKHMVLPDAIRDSAWYAIVDDDWPAVKERLRAKVDAKAESL